ncbi:MAG: Sir2 family NAD-dependent protein deacetylase [Thermomicrobiales bacterium]|nr:Sir2 family NAD-dependent protein deacetylase [Thermomicrobiales bacterium]
MLARLLAPARRIVAFTGAGISTESGIPDYRGPGGVWASGAPPTLDDFLRGEEMRRAYWERRRVNYPELASRHPNRAHRMLARLERAGRLSGVVTQNIDGLHQKAGHNPDRVIELHGSAHHVRCMTCGTIWDADVIQQRLERDPGVPECERCGGVLRTTTVLFGEPMPAAPLRRAVDLARSCDVMLVIGSSLVVQPAAQVPLVAQQAGARLALVNRESTPLDPLAELVIAADAGPTLAAVERLLFENGLQPGGWQTGQK